MQNWEKHNSLKNQSYKDVEGILLLGDCQYILLNENSKIKKIELLVFKNAKVGIFIDTGVNQNFNTSPIKSELKTILPHGFASAINSGFSSLGEFHLQDTRENIAKLLLALDLFQTLDDKLIKDICDEFGGIEHLIYPQIQEQRVFCNFMHSGQKEEARRVLQHDLMEIKTAAIVVGSLDGTPQSYVELATLFRQQNQEIKKLQAQVKQLQPSVDEKKELSVVEIAKPSPNLARQIAVSSAKSPVFTPLPSPTATVVSPSINERANPNLP